MSDLQIGDRVTWRMPRKRILRTGTVLRVDAFGILAYIQLDSGYNHWVPCRRLVRAAAPQPTPAAVSVRDDDGAYLAAQAGSISGLCSDYDFAIALGDGSGVDG